MSIALALVAGVDWTAAIGRLHPLVLHLPIGLLVALGAVEFARRLRGATEPDAARGVLVALLAISTFFAALSGWLLHESDDYGDPVELHEWLGIALLAVTIVIAVAHRRASTRFGSWLTLGLVLLVPTAHFGAVLTHGSNFLVEPWRAAKAPAPVVDAADPYSIAAPFFATYCTRCHGAEKQKGGLALHDSASLLAGGDDGAVVVPGDPTSSTLITRCRLPLDDDDHMPPEGKRQPSADELEALAEWVRGMDGEQDASLAARLAGDALQADPVEQVDATTEPETPADASTIALLHDRLVHVAPLSADSTLLLVDFGPAQLAPGELSALLEPLREHVAELDLSARELTPADLRFVASLPRLERLHLRRMQGAKLSLAPLSDAPRLTALNLAGTALAEGAVDALAELPALRTVFVWNTGLSTDELARLAEARPELAIHGASPEPDEPLEVEPEVAFETYVPENSADLRPSNEHCPISGKPVDPRYAVVAEGRVVGFCCPNCPSEFWAQDAQDSDEGD